MKNLKIKIITVLTSVALVAILIGTCFSNTGCSTIQNAITGVSTNAQQLAQIGADVKSVTETGTVLALQKDPASRVFFAAASATLTQLLTTTNTVDPSTLANALEQLPVTQLQSPEAQIALTTIIGAYDIYYQQAVSTSVDSNTIAKTLVTNLQAGIQAGLASVPAPAAPANFQLAKPESFGISLKR